MKAWKDLSTIAMPDRIASLAKDARGYPIPYFATVLPNGQPDFRIVDMQHWYNCVKDRRCSICGGVLGRHVAFVGGPISMLNRTFMDAGMHRDCARFACEACPFIAAPRFAYSKKELEVQGMDIQYLQSMQEKRPAYFGLGVTTEYRPARNGDDVVIMAGGWEHLEWWKHGVMYEREPV